MVWGGECVVISEFTNYIYKGKYRKKEVASNWAFVGCGLDVICK